MIMYAAMTDAGVRSENDDRVMVNGEIIPVGFSEGKSDDTLLAVVCDGVGGFSHGGIAAETVAKVFSDLTDMPLTQEKIKFAVAHANNEILEQQRLDAAHSKMSTTIAGVYISGNGYIVFNVGDSKVFRFRRPYLTQLSTDHTLTQEGLNVGWFTEGDEEYKKSRHVITRYIGDKERCRPNILVGENEILCGNIFLVCSDGLTDTTDIEEIEAILIESSQLSEKCGKLFELALSTGSQDNISIILMEVE
jgi:protein phosphatase